MKQSFFWALALSVLIISCSTNAVTGRKQLSLLPESELQQQAVTEYPHVFIPEQGSECINQQGC
jgi:peptidoglycan hydrolase CwlO-like protein